MIVVDASVLVTALVDDGPDGDAARARLHGEVLVAPEVVDLEVVSVVRRAVAAGRLGERRAALALHDLIELPLRRVAHRPLIARCWTLRSNLTPYDAAYVALAEELDAVLVTADQHLARAPGVSCRTEIVTATDTR